MAKAKRTLTAKMQGRRAAALARADKSLAQPKTPRGPVPLPLHLYVPPATVAGSRASPALMAAVQQTAAVPEDRLARITSAVAQLQGHQQQLNALQEQAGKHAQDIKRLQEEVLPGLMDEAGVPELTLEDGQRVVRGEEVYTNISADNASAAAKWLEDNGYGAIVRSRIVVEFEKGDAKTSAAACKALDKARVGYALTSAVHPATLKAFVKESLEAGRLLPATISVHTQPKVQLKAPLKPKATRRSALV